MTNDSLTLYKLIILYMLNKVNFPLTNTQISNFILDKGYTTYFTIQHAINDLLESDLIEVRTYRNSSQYHITKSGRELKGLIDRTPRGRVATQIAYAHLGL